MTNPHTSDGRFQVAQGTRVLTSSTSAPLSGGSRTPCSMEASQSGYESSDGIGPPMTPDLVYINGYLFKKTRTGKWQKR